MNPIMALKDKCQGIVVSIESFSSYEGYIEAAVQPKGMTIQTIILNKKRWPTKAEAKTWAKSKGFFSASVAETSGSWRIRQRAPETFSQETFRTIIMTNGADAVVGKLKA